MITLANVISLAPLLFMVYMKLKCVLIPTLTSGLSGQERKDFTRALYKENFFAPWFLVLDFVVGVWFLVSLVQLHNYNIDMWKNLEASYALRFIGVVWLVQFLIGKGYMSLPVKK